MALRVGGIQAAARTDAPACCNDGDFNDIDAGRKLPWEVVPQVVELSEQYSLGRGLLVDTECLKSGELGKTNMPRSASSSAGAGMTQDGQEEEAGGFDIQPQ